MNRAIVFLGLFLFIVSIGLFAFPELLNGVESVDIEVQGGIFVLPLSIAVLIWGAAAPDPRVTTVGGVFGNADENEMRRRLGRSPPVGEARFRPSPLESVNCRKCYTLIPARLLDCPRCATRRECRGCNKPLFFLAGAVRCAPCLKDEVYCSCPKLRRRPASRVSGGRRVG
jgi:LSD1 subclass zinc finger protein